MLNGLSIVDISNNLGDSKSLITIRHHHPPGDGTRRSRGHRPHRFGGAPVGGPRRYPPTCSSDLDKALG